ncbi:MAG TPA: L,D-transpeptidase family protein [Thermoanaerobaculia bacterium]|jgi:murein L,D-transpeptidase YcbB/YkuD|nr:L,D-transpeptidase family protein [Thermoanaerobaculia bacterium]
MKRLTVLLTAILTSVTLFAQTVDVAPVTPAARMLQSLVLSDASADRTHLRNFYGPNGFRPVWTRNSQPTPQAKAVIVLFESAEAKGLRAADYEAGLWTARMSDLQNDAAQARFDVAMTATLIRYAVDLRTGRVSPQTMDFAYEGQPDTIYLPELVNRVATSADPASVIATAEPSNPEYRRLIAALASYRRIAAAPQESMAEPLPVVAKIKVGDDYAALPQLAAKLRLYGDLAANVNVQGTKYEGAIVDGVKNFQSRHGLDADGVIAKGTFAQLNVPASQRVKQIEIAIERVRWTPVVEAPAIIVNIPEFRLRAIGEEELTMRVVVGKAAGHKTPVFDGDLKHVVFRPYWNVPPSIQRGEIAPKLTADYAAKHNYQVVDAAGRVQDINEDTVARVRKGSLQVRQKPGTSNALGLVKFLFPNDNNVYLHSTPQQSLFARARRDFSHGCVRVEDPAALAEWVLRSKPEWTKEKIKGALEGKRDDMYVNLEKPITVTITYQTVVAQTNGTVHFYEDIYGHDAKLVAALTPAAPKGAVMVAAKR